MESQTTKEYTAVKSEGLNGADPNVYLKKEPSEYSGRSMPLGQVQGLINKAKAIEAISQSRLAPGSLEKLAEAARDDMIPLDNVKEIANVSDDSFRKAVQRYMPSAEDIINGYREHGGEISPYVLASYVGAQCKKHVLFGLEEEFPDAEFIARKDGNTYIIDALERQTFYVKGIFGRTRKKVKMQIKQEVIDLQYFFSGGSPCCSITVSDPSLFFCVGDIVKQADKRLKGLGIDSRIRVELVRMSE